MSDNTNETNLSQIYSLLKCAEEIKSIELQISKLKDEKLSLESTMGHILSDNLKPSDVGFYHCGGTLYRIHQSFDTLLLTTPKVIHFGTDEIVNKGD